MNEKKKSKENYIKISRNNRNYNHIQKILKEINNKNLKISVIKYLLLQINFLYKSYISVLEESALEENETFFLILLVIYDSFFSLEKIFFFNIKNNNELLDKYIEQSENFVKNFKITSFEDYSIKLFKEIKKRELEIQNIKILNLFEIFSNSVLLELDLNRPLEELQEILKLAKNFYDKNKKEIVKNNIIFKDLNILDKELLEKIKNKRNSIIPFDEKLIYMLFIIDSLLIEKKSKEIKHSLQDYYINNYPNLDLSYILTDYYKNLLKEAKKIVNKIKKGYNNFPYTP